MRCTRDSLRRHRDLYILIAILVFAWLAEPSLWAVRDTCADLLRHFTGGAQ